MIPRFHPAVFLGAVILLCSAWLWARPEVSPAVATSAASAPRAPRPALVEPASIELDATILKRYAGQYEGRGDFMVDLTLKGGKLLVEGAGLAPFEFRAVSETEFFLNGAGVEVEFDVERDGTVRGFSANTEFGVIEMKRVR